MDTNSTVGQRIELLTLTREAGQSAEEFKKEIEEYRAHVSGRPNLINVQAETRVNDNFEVEVAFTAETRLAQAGEIVEQRTDERTPVWFDVVRENDCAQPHGAYVVSVRSETAWGKDAQPAAPRISAYSFGGNIEETRAFALALNVAADEAEKRSAVQQ